MKPPLTATEKQVALLVAWGATNKQLADLLHLSSNAVDWHLSQICQKLGVGSRDGLSAHLSRRSTAAGSVGNGMTDGKERNHEREIA